MAGNARESRSSVALRLLAAAATAIAFDVAHAQTPLYGQNYPTYALHGVAAAGKGALGADWLASTTDPSPLVTAIVAAVHAVGAPELLYAFHALMLGVYLWGVVVIADEVFPLRTTLRRAVFVAALVVLHSTLLRDLVLDHTGTDAAGWLHRGVATQYLLGPSFQPSLFGALNAASIAMFLRRRDGSAGGLAVTAAFANATYVVTSAGLLLAYAVVRARDARSSQRPMTAATRPMAIAAALLFAVVIVQAVRFAPQSADTLREAQRILVDLRIPHHAILARFMDGGVAVRAVLVALALIAARARRDLLLVLVVPLAIAIILSVVQYATGDRGLALLFPWRASALLVPVSSCLLVAWLAQRIPDARLGGLIATAVFVLATISVAGGAASIREQFGSYSTRGAAGVSRFVARTVSIAALYVVPLDVSTFRIEAGARTYVDWKSHPYRDVEVIEWYRRVRAVRAVMRARGRGRCLLARRLAESDGVTHWLFRVDDSSSCPGWVQRYRDAHFVLYEDVGP